MPVAIQFSPTAFDAGGPLYLPETSGAAMSTSSKIRARYVIQSEPGRGTHMDSHMWRKGGGEGTPNSLSIVIQYGGPAWFDTVTEFNNLPYGEVRSQLANAVERGILQVLTATGGSTATGSVTTVAKANFVDGEILTLIDATGTPVVFEFDPAGDGVTTGNVQVNISGDTTAENVAATLATAIDGTSFSASAVGNVVTITQTDTGTVGNTEITTDVADTGFSVTSFSGGGAASVSDIRGGTVA